MEDVLFYVKPIANEHLRRRVEPGARTSLRAMLLWASAALALVILAYGPRSWLRQSGFRQAAMLETVHELERIQDHLRVRHAQLGDMWRLERVAQRKGLAPPSNERYMWQERTLTPSADREQLAESFREARP